MDCSAHEIHAGDGRLVLINSGSGKEPSETSSVQLGWCGRLDQASLVHEIGYDYIELPMASFGLEESASLGAAKANISALPLPVMAFNNLFPTDYRIVGEMVDARRIKGYLARAAELAHHANAQCVVLGSGWARNVPQGFSSARAKDQILEAFGWVADAFEGIGPIVGIEALNRKEGNIINSLAEAVDYASAVDRSCLRIIADFYHMDEEQEALENLKTYAAWIAHVQVADSGRLNPGSGSYDYEKFFRYLHEGGCGDTVSVECVVDIPEIEMRRSLVFLRQHCLRVSIT